MNVIVEENQNVTFTSMKNRCCFVIFEIDFFDCIEILVNVARNGGLDIKPCKDIPAEIGEW